MKITKLEEIDIAINELFAEGMTEDRLDKEISVILDLISEYARQEVIKELKLLIKQIYQNKEIGVTIANRIKELKNQTK